MDKVFFEDIPLTIVTREEIEKYFFEVLSLKEKKYISFINPEIVLQQFKDPQLNEYFIKADKNFIDGVNLFYAINKVLKTKYSSANRIPGTDFFDYLPKVEINVFFYGAKEENCLMAKEIIEEKYPNIKICGHINGYTNKTNDEIITEINKSGCDILIVCLGCPRQEHWIKNNFNNLNTTLVFGNGGSIDFWSGKIKRAPDFIIKLGYEWLYRLFASFSFSRLKRQSKLIKFYINYKLKRYRIYRK